MPQQVLTAVFLPGFRTLGSTAPTEKLKGGQRRRKTGCYFQIQLSQRFHRSESQINQLNFVLYYKEMYVHLCVYVFLLTFCNSFFSFFVPLGPFGVIIEWHFPKRCRGLLRTLLQCMQPLVGSSCCVLQPKYCLKFKPFVALVTFVCLYL